jgi:hypothetical protein
VANSLHLVRDKLIDASSRTDWKVFLFYKPPFVVKVILLCALALSVYACLTPAQRAARNQARAERQAAQQQAMEDQFWAESPEGSKQQYDNDVATLNSLTPAQTEAIKDIALGLSPTADEKKDLDSITRDQLRAIARLGKLHEWAKQESADLKAQSNQERLIQAQEAQAQAQRAQAWAAWSAANAARTPKYTNCSNTLNGMSCTQY